LEARPGDLPEDWKSAAATFDNRASIISGRDSAGRPGIAAFGAQAAAERRREQGADDRATWSAVADAWRKAGQPYREAYARLREAEAAARAGQREHATSALTTGRAIARELPSAPLLSLATELEHRAGWTPSD